MSGSNNIEEKIAADLKTAMIAKDAVRVSVLRSLKSAFTYAKVAPNASRAADDGSLTDDAVLALVAKESKKRQESANSYGTAGQSERANDELAEKAIIDAYLPAQLSQAELEQLIEDAVAELDEVSLQSTGRAMGQIIAAVKAKAGPSADGSLIAQLVKARLAIQTADNGASQ